MRYNIVKSQLQSFVIRVISTVFRCPRRCQQVIIRARDSSQSGHSCVHRTDASAIERVCAPPERHGRGRAWSHTRTVPLLYIGGGGEGLARAGPCNGPVGQFWLAREGKAASPVASSCVRLGPARPSPCAAVLDGVPVNVYDEHGTTSFALC